MSCDFKDILISKVKVGKYNQDNLIKVLKVKVTMKKCDPCDCYTIKSLDCYYSCVNVKAEFYCCSWLRWS